MEKRISPRLGRLTREAALGREVPVARDLRSRLLGLAFLDREEAGPGLLIPGCASVHTFGMRFPLDILFLDRRDGLLAFHLSVPPRRLVTHPGAAAVLELPAETGRSVR
jgi:uncharacterized protein